MNRFNKHNAANEKKRHSGGSDSVEGSNSGVQQADGSEEGDEERATNRRQVFFNIPLPDDAKDEEGNPLAQFGRNKIRTAKYTPLSFIPKNLWYQFHTIANVYFLFLIILAVGIPCNYSLMFTVNTLSRFSLFSVRATLDSIRYPLPLFCSPPL